jgi:hypothetical protein
MSGRTQLCRSTPAPTTRTATAEGQHEATVGDYLDRAARDSTDRGDLVDVVARLDFDLCLGAAASDGSELASLNCCQAGAETVSNA